MINIDEYPIFQKNITTLKQASLDGGGDIEKFMTESQLMVINFDKVKDEYAGNLHLAIRPKSNDALYIISDKEAAFIEFKNGYLQSQEKTEEVKNKIYDSLLIFCDITGKNISETRKHLNYILVFSEEKNPEHENAHPKTEVQVSQSREAISKNVFNYAKERKIRFGLEKFKNFCFKEVTTYSKDEFEQEFVAKTNN